MSTPLYKGACLCGNVSFTMDAEPSEVNSCFCRDCQKNAGGPCQVNAEWSEKVMTIHTIKPAHSWIITNTLSGTPKNKEFCGGCGCTLWTLWERDGELFRNVRLGLIDNGLERLQPKGEYFTKNRPANVLPIKGAKQYREEYEPHVKEWEPDREEWSER